MIDVLTKLYAWGLPAEMDNVSKSYEQLVLQLHREENGKHNIWGGEE